MCTLNEAAAITAGEVKRMADDVLRLTQMTGKAG